MRNADVVIVGGGPAGLAAAVRLYDLGITDIVILEREHQMGGILKQCIHDGFGLTRFKETLSGPEYAKRFVDEAQKHGICCITDTTVIDVSADKVVTAAHADGMIVIQAKAVILTMGCRERTRGAISIPGTRPAGVMTAGVAQAYINLQNRMVGKEVVILGSGDIGMIMARRLTLEGAHVQAVFEVLPTPSGLPRNIEQCLNDYGIPLYLSHTVTDIRGEGRLTGITVAAVDERMQPIPGTEKDYDCDTLILSVGLIPENELTLGAGAELDAKTKGAFVDEFCQTTVPGIFAAGNVLHVHDLVDFVSMEAESLAEGAAEYIKNGSLPKAEIAVRCGENVGHTIPQRVSGKRDLHLSLRVRKVMKECTLTVSQGDTVLLTRRMKKALPAEMINLNIDAKKLQGAADLEVKVV